MKRTVKTSTYLLTLIAILIFGSAISYGLNLHAPFLTSFVIFGLMFVGGFLRRNKVKETVLGDFDVQDTTYVGTYETGYFITKATFSLSTVKKGVAFVKDGIKKAHNVGVLSFDDPLEPRNETPIQNPAKKVAISGRKLTPQDCMLYQEINPRDLEDHFLAEELSKTLLARELPVTVANFMIQYFLNRAFEQIEIGIHMGSQTYTATPGATGNGQIVFFDGLIKKLLTVATYIPSTAPAVLTTSNIETQMLDLYTKMPKALLENDERRKNLRYCMSVADWLIYEAFMTTSMVYKNNDLTEAGKKSYKGIPIITLAGLPKDTFYLGEFMPDINSNIWVGTNSMDDLQLMFRPLQNNSEKWFVKGLFKFDTQIRLPEEFAMHTTKILSDFSV
jgi:hypothetical protein